MTSARWATSSVQKENACVCQGGMEIIRLFPDWKTLQAVKQRI